MVYKIGHPIVYIRFYFKKMNLGQFKEIYRTNAIRTTYDGI